MHKLSEDEATSLRQIWMALRVIADEQHSVGSETFKAAWSRLLNGWAPVQEPPTNPGRMRSDAEYGRAFAQSEALLAVHKAINSVRNADSELLRFAAWGAAEVVRKILGEPPVETAQPSKALGYAPPPRGYPQETKIADSSPVERGTVRIFYSYSHRDEELRNELEAHLSTLQDQGVITGWHDRRIQPGEDWDKAISRHLDEADIILLLISADFLASGYCRGKEMRRSLERNEADQARVIPIVLRSVDWLGEAISKLQALPTDARPVTSWPNRDEA